MGNAEMVEFSTRFRPDINQKLERGLECNSLGKKDRSKADIKNTRNATRNKKEKKGKNRCFGRT